jgi:TRAP-type mannitol/chloroaromatic compound transport system permease small subunit
MQYLKHLNFLKTFTKRSLIPFVGIVLFTALPMFAQTIDTGNISAEATALITLFKFIGAAAAVAAIIFAALSIRGRNIGEGILGPICAILAIFIIGHASDWVSSITGVAVGG